MKKLIISFMLLIAAIGAYTQVTVDGNAYLELQTVHDSVRVVFQRTAPSSLYDTAYSDNVGYFSINIPTGIYNVTYSKTGYISVALTGKAFYANTTLADTTLESVGLSGALSDTLHKGIYKVTGSIEVATGDTLVIEPGVKLIFKFNTSFDVNGLLIAVGTVSDSIIFTTYDTAAAARWNGIRINNISNDNSVISFALIEYSRGSGLRIYSANPSLNHLLIRNNTMTHGLADAWNGGAGICITCNNVILDNVTVCNNISYVAGGGIFVEGSGNNLKIIDSKIENNISTNGDGGGILFSGDYLELENVKINYNTVISYDGSAIFSENGNSIIKLVNVEIIGNSGDEAITVGVIDFGNLTLINAIISNNSGRGIVLKGNGNPAPNKLSMTNCIISENGEYGLYYQNPSNTISNIANCNFWGNKSGNFYNQDILLGKNLTVNLNGDSCDAWSNIQLNPMFVNSSMGDYRLRKGSPCIDAGVNDSVTVSTDLYGKVRIFDGDGDGDTIVDMGAIEMDTSIYDITIINHPVSQTICAGEKVTLSVLAVSPDTISYQWQKDGINIIGATDSVYVLNPIALSDTGNYTCIVSNTIKSVTSDAAVLIVNPIPISDFTVNSSACLNANTTITYAGSDTTAIFNWNFNGGVINTGSGVGPYQVHWTTSGLKNISLTVTKDGCSSDTTHAVNIPSVLTAPSICIVGVDSLTKENIVVWEKSVTTAIDSFYIYKETVQAGVYNKIGANPYSAFSTFIDTGSNPAQSANRYKISVLDTCLNETDLSAYHKTNHLTINQGMGNTWNLIWDGYEGITFATYNIYRGTSENNIALLTQIASTLTSYTDLTPPSGKVYYQIEVINPNSCNPSKKGTNYSSSRSNIVNTDMATGIDEHNNTSLNIHPNPSNGIFTIFITNINETINLSITNLQGQVVYKEQLNTTPNYTKQLDISGYPKGIYFFKLMGEDIVKTEKIVIY